MKKKSSDGGGLLSGVKRVVGVFLLGLVVAIVVRAVVRYQEQTGKGADELVVAFVEACADVTVRLVPAIIAFFYRVFGLG